MSLSGAADSSSAQSRSLSRLAVAIFCLFSAYAATAAALDPASAAAVHADLTHGRADDGIARLRPALQKDPADADAHNLLCRIQFQEERWDDAAHECEQAVKVSPRSSELHMWLGRAYGEKASHVNPLQAYKLSQKVRSEFETAVTLDPHNADALADLGEYYSEAPSIVGGGSDKAEEIARKLDPLDPARAHELRGRIAEQRKDFPTAETEFKAGVSVAREPAKYWTVLASFYRRQQRWDDMIKAINSAVAADKEHGVASTYAASNLIKSNREPALAIQLLNSYLKSSKQSEDVPVFLVHARLGHLLEKQGDKLGAQREFQAARMLAKDYRGVP